MRSTQFSDALRGDVQLIDSRQRKCQQGFHKPIAIATVNSSG